MRLSTPSLLLTHNLALEPAIRDATTLAVEGEDLRQPLSEHLEHALELRNRELGPVGAENSINRYD